MNSLHEVSLEDLGVGGLLFSSPKRVLEKEFVHF